MKIERIQYPTLAGKIYAKFGSFGAFAEAMGVSRQSVCNLMYGRTEFTHKRIVQCCDLLDIPSTDIGEIFF